VWREFAENVAESLTRGMEVIAVGSLSQREFEDREGNKRTVVELEIDSIGPNLARATAKVTKTEKVGANSGGGGWGN
jgi:single-strand DNA-binding protein